ncbi:MAG: Gfo/Idh/MocA family protein [Terrimicrobiaceae bacterium]
MRPRVALIGVSGFAGLYYEDLLQLAKVGKLALTAATVINPEEELEKCTALRKAGCEIFSDYREMLATHRNRLELCAVPTGIHHHAPMTIAALHAGCHVLLEKPAAATVEEVEQMRTASLAADRFVAIGYQHMYAPETQRLKAALLDGLVGKIRMIKCLGLWPRDAAYYSRNDWAGKLKAGRHWVLDSPFNNALAHWLNLMLFFAGSEYSQGAKPVSLKAELYRTRPMPSTDTACLRIQTETGIPIMFWVSHSCQREFGPTLEICGSRGTVIWKAQQILLRNPAGESVFAIGSETQETRRHMLQAVLDRIAGRDSFLCGLEQAGLQTLSSNAAFSCAEIHTIGPEFLEPGKPDEGEAFAIRGMEEACREAFDTERLWSEMPLPWSRSAGEMKWKHFPAFPGVRTPLPRNEPALALG